MYMQREKTLRTLWGNYLFFAIFSIFVYGAEALYSISPDVFDFLHSSIIRTVTGAARLHQLLAKFELIYAGFTFFTLPLLRRELKRSLEDTK